MTAPTRRAIRKAMSGPNALIECPDFTFQRNLHLRVIVQRIAQKLAQLDMKRLSRLKKRQLTSEDELARANSGLAQAKAETALLRTRINQTKLLAPFSGVITQRLIYYLYIPRCWNSWISQH